MSKNNKQTWTAQTAETRAKNEKNQIEFVEEDLRERKKMLLPVDVI